MSEIWRITGPPENFIEAIYRRCWAVNEKNKGIWENQLQPGDIVLFHSTLKSGFTDSAISSVVGFATVGHSFYRKNENWWIQETETNTNEWPYVFDLTNVYLFTDKSDRIAFDRPIRDKENSRVTEEVGALLEGSIEIAHLNEAAKSIDPQCPQFPRTGSISRLNPIYHHLILDEREDSLFGYFGANIESPDIQDELGRLADKKNKGKTKEQLLEEARNYKSTGDSHRVSDKPQKVRIEDVVQKRTIAAIEDYTCQVCEFHCMYLNINNEERWIIEVDHIIEKHKGGDESLENLWVLCPNCHEKKTRGIIKIDPANKRVTENGRNVLKRDNHLGWL